MILGFPRGTSCFPLCFLLEWPTLRARDRKTMASSPEEVRVSLPSGLMLEGLAWGPAGSACRVLALHGERVKLATQPSKHNPASASTTSSPLARFQ